MMLLWVVLIALAAWLVLYLRPGQSTGSPTERRQDAEELLAERFARGEIDEKEFARSREVLNAEKQVSS
jgi:putative membrane protein